MGLAGERIPSPLGLISGVGAGAKGTTVEVESRPGKYSIALMEVDEKANKRIIKVNFIIDDDVVNVINLRAKLQTSIFTNKLLSFQKVFNLHSPSVIRFFM